MNQNAINERNPIPEGYFSNERPEMLSFIPGDAKHVLEVGCGEGRFAELVKHSSGAEVWGVERDAQAAQAAVKRIDHVMVGDFASVLERLPNGRFDCAVFNDVLEHMAEPDVTLREVRSKLSPGGVVVCSLPNVLHVSVLKTLLWDKDWKYRPFGVLDRTHLRFFTKKSIRRMFDETDYDLLVIRGINASCRVPTKILTILSLGYFAESRFQQYACVARPRNSKEAQGE